MIRFLLTLSFNQALVATSSFLNSTNSFTKAALVSVSIVRVILLLVLAVSRLAIASKACASYSILLSTTLLMFFA